MDGYYDYYENMYNNSDDDYDPYVDYYDAGYDDLSDDIQEEELEELELSSKFCDYHPYWKKSKISFLDLFFVAERTKELIDLSREFIIDQYSEMTFYSEELTTSYENVLKHLAVSKKTSMAILSKVLGLPDLVIDKIFINIVESYNWHFDQFGPEEITYQYEEGHSSDDEDYPEFYYDMISKIYERIQIIVIPSKMKELGFEWDGSFLDGIDGNWISDSDSGDG